MKPSALLAGALWSVLCVTSCGSDARRFDGVAAGMTEAEVVKRLGQPDETERVEALRPETTCGKTGAARRLSYQVRHSPEGLRGCVDRSSQLFEVCVDASGKVVKVGFLLVNR